MTSDSTERLAARTVSATFGVGRAADADKYLTAAVEAVKLRPDSYMSYNNFPVQPDRKEDDPVRQLLALAGIGQALLALGDRLDDRLADVADAVTDVQDQVAGLCEAPRPGRRWGRGRAAAHPALSSADMTLIRHALADAAAWCRVDECSAGAENERLAFSYLALRERLGGDAQ